MFRFRSWLRRLFPTRTPSRPIARLRFDRLEDRSVPAVFTVSTTADAGAGSLRQAILDSNAAAGAGPSIGYFPSFFPTIHSSTSFSNTASGSAPPSNMTS